MPDGRLLRASLPAGFFVGLWRIAQTWTATTLASVPASAAARSRIERAARVDDGETCARKLRAAVDRNRPGDVLTAMQVLDEVFLAIHPRALLASPTLAPNPPLPSWLRDLRDLRAVDGCYWQDETVCLIPRGPLGRTARAEGSSNTACLDEWFAALTVVPRQTAENQRPIAITCRVIGGMDPGRSLPGAETIGFIPLAETADDLDITVRDVGGNSFARFHPAAGFTSADNLIDALDRIGAADIVLAPELVMPEAAANTVAERLCCSPLTTPPRLLLAGTGNSTTPDTEGFPWNEARVLSGTGRPLWRQRKLQIAGIKPERAKGMGLPRPTGALLYEDNACGDELVIGDVEGLGRCVVLICQDIEAIPLSDMVIERYQPDWVLVPILDSGLHAGRWVHQRTFALSRKASSRFLIVSSTAMTNRTVPSGLAVGPLATTAPDEERCCAFVTAKGRKKPKVAVLTWREGRWEQTALGKKRQSRR